MKQVTINLYEYHELDDKAKVKARNWFYDCISTDNWWECTYEDAAQAGLKLKNFELDSASFVRGLTGSFTTSAAEVMEYILANHGEHCDTYKAALKLQEAACTVTDDDALETLGEVFLDDLLKCYTKLLQEQLEHIESVEYLADTITVNEYTFLANGERYEAGV